MDETTEVEIKRIGKTLSDISNHLRDISAYLQCVCDNPEPSNEAVEALTQAIRDLKPTLRSIGTHETD